MVSFPRHHFRRSWVNGLRLTLQLRTVSCLVRKKFSLQHESKGTDSLGRSNQKCCCSHLGGSAPGRTSAIRGSPCGVPWVIVESGKSTRNAPQRLQEFAGPLRSAFCHLPLFGQQSCGFMFSHRPCRRPAMPAEMPTPRYNNACWQNETNILYLT